MARINGDLGNFREWHDVDVWIEGEGLAKDALRKKRKTLEEIVAPCISKRNTSDVIMFKGKRRFIKRLPLGELWYAMLALQHLYQIESAWKSGDVDTVVRQSYGLATAEHERQNYRLWKSHSLDALAEKARRGSGQNKAAQTLERKKAKKDAACTRGVQELMSQRGIAYTPACAEYADARGMSFRAVWEHTPSLRPGKKQKKIVEKV